MSAVATAAARPGPVFAPANGGRVVRDALHRHRRLVRLLLVGLLWAVAITAIETPNIPTVTSDVGELARVGATFLLHFSIESMIFAVAIYWATSRQGSWLRMPLAIVVASVVASAVIEFTVIATVFRDGATRQSIVGKVFGMGPFIWNVWLGLVYGSFAAVIYTLRRRIDQTTRALADATLARERNEAAITEARIQSMVERIEPTFLLDVMDAARKLYPVDLPRAEAIINECVEFLRTAMPQIRSGRSTLEAEIDVAEAFMTLRALTIDGCPPWKIDRGTDHAIDRVAAKLALPPLVLLPVLERLMTRTAGLASPTSPLQVRLRREGADLLLTIDSPSTDRHVVEDERLDAITVRLRRACGGSIVLVERDDGGLRYVVSLPDAAPVREPSRATGSPLPAGPQASPLETLR